MNEEDLMKLTEEPRMRELVNLVIDHARQAERDRCCGIVFRLCENNDVAQGLADAIRNKA